jgi:hypothetical protein
VIDSTELDLTGPLFTRKPGQTIRDNIGALMERLAGVGASETRRGYAAGSGSREPVQALGGRVADRVVGRVVARASHGGRRWHASGVIQVYNEGLSVQQGRSLMAAASVLEGRQNVIRKATREIGRQLRSIDLTAGLE